MTDNGFSDDILYIVLECLIFPVRYLFVKASFVPSTFRHDVKLFILN